jgi:hypothetical protein
MKMSDTLAIYQEFDNVQRAALALYKSGYFTDVKSEAQAVVKVMAGAELGLPPFASMTGIHIIQGKPVPGSNLAATLVKNDPRYDYRIKTCDDRECLIHWFEDGNMVGTSSFTIDEAKAAGLTNKDSWKKYPSDMLFARALTRGARRHAPGVFGGSPVYTPEELGADEDEEGNIVDVPVKKHKPDDDQNTLEFAVYEIGNDGVGHDDQGMSVEFAEDETGSDGVRYGDKDTDQLQLMANAIQKKMDKGGYGAEELDDYSRKLTACRVILANRNG